MTAQVEPELRREHHSELEKALRLERHNSIAPVPDRDRDAKPMDQAWIWAGANIAPINWVLGALGIVLGLGFWDTVLALALGNIVGMGLFGLFVLMGQRTGTTQMVMSRSAFGRRGAYLPAVFQLVIPTGWIAINTWIILELSATLFEKIGIPGTDVTKVILVLVIMGIQVALATLGFYAIRTFEKWTVPLTLVVLVAMSIVAWTKGDIDWNFAGTAEGAARWTAISQVMTAIGIGWGIGWLPYSADYSRFVPRGTSRRRLFTAAALGQFLPVMWLGVLGASIATTGTGADPAVIIVQTFGALSLPVLLLVIHGPIATNILNVYSMSVAALALDVKVPRHILSLVVGVLATVFTIVLVFAGDIATNVDSWLAGVVAWVSPWAAIMFVHYFVVRRGNIDVRALYQSPRESRVGDVNWAAVASLVVGLVITWMFLYGLVGPLQGPIARALNGVDLSWAAGLLVTGTLYYTLCRLGVAVKRPAEQEPARAGALVGVEREAPSA